MRSYNCVSVAILFILSAVFPLSLFAQSFVGLNNGDNYIQEVYTNPAFATTDDAYQINVGGFSLFAGNNAYSFSASNVLPGADLTYNSDYQKLDDKASRFMWANLEIDGPGISFRVKKKYSFAITTRMRYLANADNLNNNVFKLLETSTADTTTYTINNFSFTSQLFSEINLIYSGYLYQSEVYNLQGGVALKLLSGTAAAGLGITHADFNINNNVLTSLNGNANVGFSPYANEWLSVGQPFSAFTNNTGNFGMGLDLGLSYVYSPVSDLTGKHDGYTFKLGVSITDIGSINYTASSTTGSYKAVSDTFAVDDLNRSSGRTYGQSIHQYLNDSLIHQTSSKTKFREGLPTALHINADLKVAYGREINAYVSANILLNLRKPSANKFVSHYISTFNVTPRVLWKQYGAGIPLTFNNYKQGSLGLILYAGPIYIGSGSLINYTSFHGITGVDFFAGACFRIKGKKEQY